MIDYIPSSLTEVIKPLKTFDEDRSSGNKPHFDRFVPVKGDEFYASYGYVYDKETDRIVLYPGIVTVDMSATDKYYPYKIDTKATFQKMEKDKRYETLLDDEFCVVHGDGDVYDRYKNAVQHIIMCVHNGKKFLFYYANGASSRKFESACQLVLDGRSVDDIKLMYTGYSSKCYARVNNPLCVCTIGDDILYVAEPSGTDSDAKCGVIYQHKDGEVKNIFYSETTRNERSRSTAKTHLFAVNKIDGSCDAIITNTNAQVIINEHFTNAEVWNVGEYGEGFCVHYKNYIVCYRVGKGKLIKSTPVINETEDFFGKYNSSNTTLNHPFSLIKELSEDNTGRTSNLYISDDITHDILMVRFDWGRDQKFEVYHVSVASSATYDAGSKEEDEQAHWKAITWENGKYIGHLKCVLRRYSNDGIVVDNEVKYDLTDKKIPPYSYIKIYKDNHIKMREFGPNVFIDVPYLEKNSDGEYVLTEEFKGNGEYLKLSNFSLEDYYSTILVTRNSLDDLLDGKIHPLENFTRSSSTGL